MSADHQIFAEGIRDVSLANGVLRITFDRLVKDSQSDTSGTLYIPLVRAGAIIGALGNTWATIVEQLKKQQAGGGGQNGGAGGTGESLFDDGGNLKI